MRERGIDISSRGSRHFSALAGQQFDYVVSLCDRVREACPDFPGPPQLVHWSIPDPSAGGGADAETYPAFRALAADLETRIGFLLSRIAASAQEAAGQPVPGTAGGPGGAWHRVDGTRPADGD
jgi:protein-tyrosine-phosphatase